jgi:hypothetical protein
MSSEQVYRQIRKKMTKSFSRKGNSKVYLNSEVVTSYGVPGLHQKIQKSLLIHKKKSSWSTSATVGIPTSSPAAGNSIQLSILWPPRASTTQAPRTIYYKPSEKCSTSRRSKYWRCRISHWSIDLPATDISDIFTLCFASVFFQIIQAPIIWQSGIQTVTGTQHRRIK